MVETMDPRSLILPLPDSKLLIITASECNMLPSVSAMALRLETGIQDAPAPVTPFPPVDTSHMMTVSVSNAVLAQLPQFTRAIGTTCRFACRPQECQQPSGSHKREEHSRALQQSQECGKTTSLLTLLIANAQSW